MANNIKVGDSYSHEFYFTQDQVVKFAEASGDYNPIHLDEKFAKESIFKRKIIHGFLGGSVFSKVFGTLFPGNGTIYLSQNMNFKRPMFTETKYRADFKILEIIPGKNRAVCETVIYNEASEVIIEGNAVIQHESL